jgi:hypothetical protein
MILNSRLDLPLFQVAGTFTITNGAKFTSGVDTDAMDRGDMRKMLRHYFISDNLDGLEVFETDLEAAGISTPQIHVLSRNDAEVEHHQRLHEVQSIMKRDMFHSTKRGARVGLCASIVVLGAAYFAGPTPTAAGWMPFVFLAVVLLGFCAWEGGLLGIEKPNHNFARFEQALNDGKHVLFVDLKPHQDAALAAVLKSHPGVKPAGTGASAPRWLIALQQRSGMIRHS